MIRPDWPTQAFLFDGETPVRHRVKVTVLWQTPPALLIEGDAPGLPARWPLDRIRALPDEAETTRLVVTCRSEDGDETGRDPVRLIVTDQLLRDWILASRPNLFRRDLPKGMLGRVARRAAIAGAAFAAIVFVILPALADQLAGAIPPEREAAFGRATVRQMEFAFSDGGDDIRCASAPAQAVWDSLATRLASRSGYRAPIEVIVLDHPMINAFAAPGGNIVMFRGMLDEAESPDEIAAVLAHEIGHVAARDPTRAALRSVGTVGLVGLVLGDFAGGSVVLAMTEQLMESSYSREAEAAADRYAFDAMVAERIDPAALGDLFERMRNRQGDISGLAAKFMSHPALSARIAESRAESIRVRDPAPSLSEADFATLKASCG